MTGYDEADRALQRLSTESDRMADALVAMDSHAGHQLLRNATLTGVTKRRWAEASAAMTVLWEQFNLHRRMVEQAKELRDQRDLGALGALLNGPVVELNAQQLPIEQRSLTGPAIVTERVTLTELVERMKASYKAITEVLAAADTAWTATIQAIDPLETEVRSVSALAVSLGVEDPELAKIEAELAQIRELVLADPLAAGTAQAPDRLAAGLADVRARLTRLASAKDTFDDRMARIEALLGEVAGAYGETQVAHATVMQKIASPGLPRPTDLAGPLRARLTELPELWRAGQWRELASGLDGLERDATSALADARTQLRMATGLLDRRLELRGRLEAYRAKANRLGHAEDLDLAELHRVAHGVLYSTPCDLPAATRAVNRYQQALQEKRSAAS